MTQLFRPNGWTHITEQIRAATEAGSHTATITGCWEIDTAVRIPSNFTLILDGCHLRRADSCYSNLFVNEHHDTPEGVTAAGTDRNISILGKNGAILDGGSYNGLSERNQLRDGLPPIWKNNLLLFTNVDGFEICNIACRNQRWWALNFICCCNGSLHDIDFTACDLSVDPDGNLSHGLTREHGLLPLVKNADGIDLRIGCHDISIQNITGFTEDDSVALTALCGRMENTFRVEGMDSDIRNIIIRDVATSAFCSNVRLLNQGGTKLHDILIDGVCDTSAQSPYMDRGIYTVRVGDTRLYGSRHATRDETYNITIRNIRSRAANAAIALAGEIAQLTVEHVECFDGTPECEDNRPR